MNNWNLRVKTGNEKVELTRPVFVWTAPAELRQFTIQLSPLPNFAHITTLRDTREAFFLYDGNPLKANTTYFIRVRSGLGEWSETSFTTGNETP